MSAAGSDPLCIDRGELLPVVVQDAGDRRVLMLAYMNDAALEETKRTGRVHFWSRSRQQLWEKGATSGNHLDLVELLSDCDGDALLVRVRPTGAVCHTGSATCFEDRPGGEGFAALEELWSTILDRAARRPEGSYTARLLGGGIDACARKVIEEAGEVVLAAKNEDEAQLVGEAADLLYHLMVLLAERRVAPRSVLDELVERRRSILA